MQTQKNTNSFSKSFMTVTRLRTLSGVIAGITLVLIGLGGYVRATGAGLSCPDWHLCYGRAVPDFSIDGVPQEVIHRYLAGVLTLLIVGFSLVAHSNRRKLPRLWLLAKGLLAVLACQIVLGGLTVILLLNPFIVTAHLALGTLVFQSLGLLSLEKAPGLLASARQAEHLAQIKRPLRPKPQLLNKLTLTLAALVYLQIILGGFVGSSGASLACSSIPFCNPGSLLGERAPQYVQMLHRTLAIVILLFSACLLRYAPELSGGELKSRGHLIGIFSLLLLQIGVGLANVYLLIPVHVTLTHLVVAQLILLGVLRFYFRLNPEKEFLYSPELLEGEELSLPRKRTFVANY